MPVPKVTVTKNPFSLPATAPTVAGILAIIASSQSGTVSQPGAYANPNLALTVFGYGPLTEYAAYDMSVSGNPVVLMKPATTSVAATYGTVTKSGTGTFTPTAGGTSPLEHYNVLINFIVGTSAIGTAGATYTFSVDGGNTTSAVQALGTAASIVISNTGVTISLGAGTIVAGDSITCYTERALMNDADATTALGTLNNSNQAFEMVLLDMAVANTTIAAIDGVVAGWEANGKFKIAMLNTRFKNEPQPATESEAAYATAMATAIGSGTSERCLVGADGAHVPSSLTGYNLKRPTSLLVAARAMALSPNIGVDPAYVASGPIQGATIADSNGNPLDHDEFLFPNLDQLGLTALRSFAPGGPGGVYVNNANIISPSTSVIKYLQQLRVLNSACSIAWQILTTQLSLGVRTQVNPNTGALNIAEIDAQKIEGLVNPTLKGSLQGQVTSAQFVLNRDDNLQANPPTVGGQVQVVALVYVKNFSVVTAFVKQITTGK